MVMPFLWMISASLKPESDVFSFPVQWIPKTLMVENYQNVWCGKVPFYLYYWNSLKVTAMTLLGAVSTSLLSAYAFAKINFRGKKFMFMLYLSTLMFPSQVLLISRFVIYNFMGLYNSLWALIIPGSISTFGTFLLRQFFSTIPEELSESARLDGCGHWQIFTKIALPLIKPGLTTFIVFSFVWCWNDYENPLVFISDNKLFTIPLGLLSFQDENKSNFSTIMAASVCSLLPIFLIFLSAQKYFVEGIALSGIKE